jgi:CheY-like chemotaxis protein
MHRRTLRTSCPSTRPEADARPVARPPTGAEPGATATCLNNMTGPAQQPKSNHGAPVVLVVEDEALLRTATAEYLRMSGYRVIEAADAAEAIGAFVSGEPVDVVFSDVRLPGSMDGSKLAGWVRHHRNIPVMLTSGHPDAALMGECFAAKPYRAKDVVSRIRLLLEEARGREAKPPPRPAHERFWRPRRQR